MHRPEIPQEICSLLPSFEDLLQSLQLIHQDTGNIGESKNAWLQQLSWARSDPRELETTVRKFWYLELEELVDQPAKSRLYHQSV